MGDVDTACLVLKPHIAVECFDVMLKNHAGKGPDAFYTIDIQFFLHVRDQMPGARINVASCRPIAVHDGLRIPVYIRSLFGLPSLGIARRILRRDLWSK
jgi:hypothetical protein